MSYYYEKDAPDLLLVTKKQLDKLCDNAQAIAPNVSELEEWNYDVENNINEMGEGSKIKNGKYYIIKAVKFIEIKEDETYKANANNEQAKRQKRTNRKAQAR